MQAYKIAMQVSVASMQARNGTMQACNTVVPASNGPLPARNAAMQACFASMQGDNPIDDARVDAMLIASTSLLSVESVIDHSMMVWPYHPHNVSLSRPRPSKLHPRGLRCGRHILTGCTFSMF